MIKRNIFIIGLFLIPLLFYVNYLSSHNEVCFEENCFDIEIVSEEDELKKGLMFRESLDEDKGMLFVFPEEGIYNFWMRDTLISLDIIWINSNNEVVFIKENAQPCEEDPCEQFNPESEALYVLELNSGKVNEIGLEIGDKLDINLS